MAQAMYDFSDETVVITGATSGIGREVALRFGQAGATVINADVDRIPKDAETPTDELIREKGGHAEYIKTDVSDVEALRSVIQRAENYGGVNIMVNNAGIQIRNTIKEANQSELEQLESVNINGVFFGTQVAANSMIENENEGVIINTASISSNLTQFGQVPYDTTKGAVRMVTRSSALELAEYGIRVNGVAPGQIATEFTEGWSKRAKQKGADDELIKPIPIGRAGTPKEVAGVYLFLATSECSYITGEIINVDGGWQII